MFTYVREHPDGAFIVDTVLTKKCVERTSWRVMRQTVLRTGISRLLFRRGGLLHEMLSVPWLGVLAFRQRIYLALMMW